MNKGKEEMKIEQGHEPQPGYKTAFYIVFFASVLYLAFIMAVS